MTRQATPEDCSVVAALAQKLWPSHTRAELEREFDALLADGQAAVFLHYAGENAVAFAQCQLRHDYVEGTSGSPVGYLEGIFVDAAYRNRGIASSLLRCCEVWAREQGCAEFASDCELENGDSLAFHLRAGFVEANRIICFTKRL